MNNNHQKEVLLNFKTIPLFLLKSSFAYYTKEMRFPSQAY